MKRVRRWGALGVGLGAVLITAAAPDPLPAQGDSVRAAALRVAQTARCSRPAGSPRTA